MNEEVSVFLVKGNAICHSEGVIVQASCYADAAPALRRSTRHGSVRVLARLTQSGIKHVKRHLVSLLGAGDGDEALIVVVGRLVDLDDAATQLTDLINLLTTFADDSANHVVRNENLLRDGLSRVTGTALHRLLRRSGMTSLRWTGTAVGLRLLRASASISSTRRARAIAHLTTLLRLHGLLSSLVRHTGLASWWASRLVLLAAEVVRVPHLPTSVLRHIRNDLHATRNDASRCTTAGGISRSCSASEAVRQLLHQGAAYVISGNVNGICNTQDDQGTLGG